jgi:hypothetical protein
MARKHKHHDAGAQNEAPEGPQGETAESYKLDADDKFKVPNCGAFKLNLAERRVERVPGPVSPESIAETVYRRAEHPDFAQVYQHALYPDAIAAFEKAMAPDARYGFVKRFEDIENLHAHVLKIAELSRNMQKLGEPKPRFVLGVGVKDDKDAGLKVDVESALRGHGVDAHVVMMSKAARGGRL